MSGFFTRYTQGLARLLGTSRASKPKDWDYRKTYEMDEAYYTQNAVYDAIANAAPGSGDVAKKMKEMRNPVFAAVEFYAKTVWPGALPDALPIIIPPGKEAVRDAIQQIWSWSNWGQQKVLMSRHAPLYGDCFLKVCVKQEKEDSGNAKSVYLQVINPKYVTDFKKDERGFVTYLRYDVRVEKDEENFQETQWHTEVWDKDGFRKWRHTIGPNASIRSLGKPKTEDILTPTQLRIDFVPWVHAPFICVDGIQSDDQRGMAVFWPCLSKIDDLALNVTRFAQLLFRHNRPVTQIKANAMTPDGRPMAPPSFDAADSVTGKSNLVIDLDGDPVYRMPGNSSMECLVPNINYDAHRAFILDSYEALKIDLPELRYYGATEMANESGVAVLAKLSPAIDKVLEVRGNLETALAQADAMALSLAIAWQAPGFTEALGSFDAGDFAHSFKARPVFRDTEEDTAKRVQIYCAAGMPIETALREFSGFSDDRIAKMREDRINAAIDEAGTTTGPNSPPMEQAVSKAVTKQAVIQALEPRMTAVIQKTAEMATQAVLDVMRGVKAQPK